VQRQELPPGYLHHYGLQPQIARKATGPASGSPGDAFARATAGAPSALPHQEKMEASFGQSFAGVAAHVGTPGAQAGLADLGARAAAFGERVAFTESSPSEHLVAHELAHVVQQRNGGGGVQAKANSVSEPGDAAELAADRAADAVVHGERVGDVGTADQLTLHRTTVNTNGGVFDNGPMYQPVPSATGAVGTRVGANIMIDFIPGDLVEAPTNGIAIIQTVKGVTDRVPGTNTLHATRDQGNTAVTSNADDIGLVAGNGVAIDSPTLQTGQTKANNNPIYFGVSPRPSTTLNDGQPTTGRTRRGSHVKRADGTFDPPVNAQMEDGPGRRIQVAGQTFEMNFEVTALVTAGPMTNTYLGSVEWGWQSDATGGVTTKPFVPLASGAPTANFSQAATAWNNSTFHNADGTTVASVDLPLATASGRTAAVDMRTADIITRLATVRSEVAALPAGPSVERTNKEFEQRALDTELRRRKITLDLICNSISDTGGAAVPAEDEVWLSLEGGGAGTGFTLTSTRTFRAGQMHTYQFPVTDFLPLNLPVRITINEHDRAGTRSAAHDDVLIDVSWAPPFVPLTRAEAHGHYLLVVNFDK
jgi:hypothetical protein